jgi:hypothetical protein
MEVNRGMRHRIVAGVVLCAVLMIGCDALWNLGNRGQLARDITEIFEKQGVRIAHPVCHMVGTTRDGVCTFRASAEQIAAAVRGLGLQETSGTFSTGSGSSHAMKEVERVCTSKSPFGEQSGLNLYQLDRRPEALKLSHGGAFEFMLLYYHPSQDVCVGVSYAYG